MEKLLQKVSANPENPNWENIIKRQNSLYKRDNEIRSEFERDYTRVINSKSYRRLKHKTQVFFSPENIRSPEVKEARQLLCLYISWK